MSAFAAAMLDAQVAYDSASKSVLAVYDGSLDEVLAALFVVRGLRQKWQQLESALETEATQTARELHVKEGEVAGIGGFQVRTGRDRNQWDHHNLAAEVTRKHLEQSGGSFEPSELVSAILAAAQVSGWRVTVLRPLGIEPDDYCKSVAGRSTVQFGSV